MHVDVVLDIVELSVGFAAVFAFEELVRPPGAEVGLEPLDVAAVVAVGVTAFFPVNFCRVYVGLLTCDILLKVKLFFLRVFIGFDAILTLI